MSQTKKSLPLSRQTLAWVTWGLAALFYYYEFSLQVSPSVMAESLAQSFKVQAAGLGALSAYFFYAYSLMQLPVGILLDKFGPRRMLTFALVICSLGTLTFSLTETLATAELARFFIGAGSAFSVISCFKLAANWFPPQRFALLTGLLLTIGMLGAAAGQAPLALLVSITSWRHVLVGFSVVGAILACAIYAIVRDHPPDNQLNTYYQRETIHSVLIGLKKTLKKPQIWLSAIYGSLMFAPTVAFGALWAVPYLTRHFDITKSVAGAIMTLFFIGWAIGATVFGAYSDAIGKRKPCLYISSIGLIIILSILLYIPMNIPWIMVVLFLFGFLNSAFLPIFSIVKEITPPQHAATSLGFTNTLNMAGGAILQYLIGVMLNHGWTDTVLANGQRYYPLHLYTIALSVLPLCALVALFFLPFIKETYCYSINSEDETNAARSPVYP